MQRALLAVVAFLTVVSGAQPANAQQCRELRFAFQPDCFRPSLASACNKPKTGDRLDLGPQIAVWLQSADAKRFVDSLMVTNLIAFRGLGNRPGRWNFRSSPKFPYGKRIMALPVWAYARGRTYDVVEMQDGYEDAMGFHESISSPDPYYCRPMSYTEIDVDAVTCPTAVFNSAKGKFTTGKTYYPPRNDLRRLTDRDCDVVQGYGSTDPNCKKSAALFANVNDLDAVATATPPYGRIYEKSWGIPADLPAGEYALFVEVSKEFDFNDKHLYEAFQDKVLPDSGMPKSIGQPSVVYRVPVKLDGTASYGSAIEIVGYGAWNGADGQLRPRDSTISREPGSGEGRLLAIAGPWDATGAASPARVHVTTVGCNGEPLPPPTDGGAGAGGGGGGGAGGGSGCSTTPDSPAGMSVAASDATTVSIAFRHSSDHGAPVAEYELRVREGQTPFTPEDFQSGLRATDVRPGQPGTAGTVLVTDLQPETTYIVGMRARGDCFTWSSIAQTTVRTSVRKYAQVEGCFIATAAFGTAMASRIDVLRRARDQAVGQSPVASASVDLYYRSSPPVADAVRGNEAVRAATRRALAPLVGIAEAIEALTAGSR